MNGASAKPPPEPMTVMKKLRIVSLPLLGLLFVTAVSVAGQSVGSPLGGQSLRPYWHVFIAYAVVIALILGWVVSIARRLANLEARLVD